MDESVTPVAIIIYGVQDPAEKMRILNSLKDQISSKNITFKYAEEKCILLLCDFNNIVLQNSEVFENEMTNFLVKICKRCDITPLEMCHMSVVLSTDFGKFLWIK